jgi:glycolate oxidase
MGINSLKPYETDSSQLIGKTTKVHHPEEIRQVQEIIKKIKHLTIRGGGTGLAGGATPQNEEILDMSKLDKILEFDKDKKGVIVEAGVILDELQEFLEPYELEFPINPSSHGICTIGGMIATNAVGSRALKYGKTSEWVLWLEIVDPCGKIERKHKSELGDFVGMEGITGIILKAGLKLSKRCKRFPKIIKLNNLEDTINKVKELKQKPEISIIEFIDKQVSKKIGLEEKYHLFIESEILEESKDNYKDIYNVRDKIYPTLADLGHTIIEDPKLTLDKIITLLEWLEERKVPTYGHISTGILHPCFSQDQKNLIPEMMKLVKRLGGKISGEHGIGILKKEFVDPNDLKIIKNIKKRLDPENKFNPGKIL